MKRVKGQGKALQMRQLDAKQLKHTSGGRGGFCGAVVHCDCGAVEAAVTIDLGYCDFVGWLGSYETTASGGTTCPACGQSYY